MARNEEVRFQIIGGPGKFELMEALFTGRKIFFTLGTNAVVHTRITSIEQEDGSFQSWNLKGFIVGHGQAFTAYYSTKRNHGWFLF